MKKLLISLMIIGFLQTSSPNNSCAFELPIDLSEEVLIKQLQEPILSVVGADWFRGKEKILDITQDEGDHDAFFVTVQVVTFQGPHNPPYMQEIITFKIKDDKVKPTDYFNKVIPESEWHKFDIP
ncbi:MAG TPA: DUF3888 domain-containing protein [Bacillus sp. (in: firmicutes)]|nr:DUF3888 domain-containing protein [Bacillus sp. (in: firmicutes)]